MKTGVVAATCCPNITRMNIAGTLPIVETSAITAYSKLRAAQTARIINGQRLS